MFIDVDDIPQANECTIALFADDTALYVSSRFAKKIMTTLEKATKNADKISSIIYPLSQGFKGKFTHATITGEITPTFDFNSIPQITRVKWATQLDDASEVAKTIKKIVAEIKTSNTIIDKQPE